MFCSPQFSVSRSIKRLCALFILSFTSFGFPALAVPANTWSRPFSPASIWNRTIPTSATYHDVSDAIWGNPSLAPNRVSVEQITIIYTDPSQPEVSIVKSRGWYVPGRTQTDGQVLYTRRFAPDAGIEVRYPRSGNASFVIIDPATGIATEGSAGWREPDGNLITYYDEPRIHNIDLRGNGLSGTLGSGLPALGGLVRVGELKNGINHSIAIALSSRSFSRANHFVAPAWRADTFAGNWLHGYFGDNPRYTMGTVLAIPYSVDINQVNWKTPEGKTLAQSAQKYGWIIVDSNDGGRGDDQMKLNFSRQAASDDLGLEINPENDNLFVARQLVDVVGMEADIIKIMGLVMATTK